MVRFVTITIPVSKAEVIVPLLHRLQDEEKIWQPQVQVQSMINLSVPFGSETSKASSLDGDAAKESSKSSREVATQETLLVTFKTKDKQLKDVMVALERKGIGSKVGQIDVVSLVLTKPAIASMFIEDDDVSTVATGRDRSLSVESNSSNYDLFTPIANIFNSLAHKAPAPGKDKPARRKYRISDRMTIEEIESFIDDGNHLTFNYLALLTCASMIAGAGLLGDSATTVIASMLVSPLMGPILSITFGLAIRHEETIKRGFRNEVVGILVSFVVGLAMGAIASFCYPAHYRSAEMVGRGTVNNLIYGFVVAFASGIAVVLGITMGGVNAIVGTAISASLLPPVVNSGMCMAMAIIYHIAQSTSDVNEISDAVSDYYQYSGVSFCLFAVNFVVIVIVGFFTFRYVKRIYPLHNIHGKAKESHQQEDKNKQVELV